MKKIKNIFKPKEKKNNKQKNYKRTKNKNNLDKTRIYNEAKNIKERLTKIPLSKYTLIFLVVVTILVFIIMKLMFGTLLAFFGIIIFIVLIIFSQILDRNPKNSKTRKIVKTLFIIGLIGMIIGIIAFVIFFIYISIISANKFDVKKLDRSETTIIYDNKNEVMATLGSEKREKLTYDEIPEILVDAIIATEDSRFFQHNGLDAPRFLKAVLGQLAGSGDAGGGSTITMQVSKNNFTSFDASGLQGIIRKFSDIYLSIFKIEKKFTKQQILEYYVNTPYLGGWSYGIEQASQTYFGKHASELNLSEAAIIAGLFQAPGAYDPLVDPKATTERRSTVLSLMVKHGYITEEEKNIAEAIKVEDLINSKSSSSTNIYQDYIDAVVKEITNKYDMSPVTTPMLIYTNMDRTKQEAMNNVFNGTTFSWANDTIQGGAVALDSKTGNVVAIGAGRNRKGELTYSYATDINRQIGSTAKPLFDYAPGIEYLNWSTGQIFDDKPWSYSGSSSRIVNYDGAYLGKITMRYSLVDSRNVPAVQAFQMNDNKKIKNFVTTLGIKPEIDSNGYIHEAHAVGAFNGASPLQMAGAYAAFSNGGYYLEPTTIKKIVIRDSEETIEPEREKVKAMSDSTAYMMTDMLREVPSHIGASYVTTDQLAAKTGTTNYDTATANANNYPYNATPDGWIVGYTPDMVVAIWTGYTENIKGVYLTQNQMVNQRNGLFKACAKATLNNNGSKFTKPSSVISVKLEKGTTLLASESTPSDQIVTELFKKGTEPTETSSRYKKLDNVESLKIKYENNTSKLTWNSVIKPKDISDSECGTFGYDIYFNDKKIGFTTNSYYNYETDDPYGTYIVKTICKNSDSNSSSGSKVTLETNIEIKATITDITLSKDDTFIEETDKISVTEEGLDVTSLSTINVTITNSNNEIVTKIDTSIPDKYTVTYEVSYKSKTKIFTQNVIIE